MTNQQQFFARVKPGALKGWHSHKILPSITGAQAALETGWGGSSLANPPYNNFFGIKAGDDWTGEVVTLPTQEWDGSRYITINDTFRAYPTLDDSIADHAAFFTSTAWRVNNYRRVVGEMDYKTASQALQDSGYATDPGYARKLINIIETYNLQSWDSEAFSGEALKKDETLDVVKDNTNPEKVVGGYISNPASREIEDYAVTFIGDENGKEAEEFLKQYKFANEFFDNYEGRQWENSTQLLSGVKTIDTIENAGNLYKNIVVILGTNGEVDSRYINSLVNTAGRERNIILVDSPAELPNRNKTYRIYENASKQHANVYYANWSSHSRINIGSYYNADGPNGTRITINKTGAKELAKFIVESVFQANSRDWNNYATKPITRSKEYVDISSLNYKDDLLESPEGDSSIYNPSLNSQFGFRPGGNNKIMWIERMYEGQEDSSSELMANALSFMREHSEPGVQYTVSLRDLPEDISLGDEGIIVDHEFNPPLYIKARVLEMTTSETNPDNNQVVIGNVEEIFPQEKSDILALQKSLQDQRDEYVDNYFTPKPVDIIIEKSNGNTLSSEGFNKGKNLIADLDGKIEVVDGSATLNLRVARKEKASYTLFGKIEDNFIDTVDEFVSNIEDDDVVDFTEPIDPETNPQGVDTPNPLDDDPIRELKHKSFIVQYINTSGEVIKEEEIFIYEDSTFTHPVIDITERIDKIEILFSNTTALSIGAIAFLENDSIENSEYSKTRLYAKSFVEGEEVTFNYKNYQWTRVSDNYLADEQWNDKNKFNTTNALNVTPEDVEGEESTFIVKSFDDDGVYVSATAETISILSNGKSAYDLWIEAGNEGSELDYLLSLKGENGQPGSPGDDGKTPWTHVAYGNLVDGKIVDFSVDDPIGKEYLGTVTNYEEGNPKDPDVYTWVKVKGEKGEDGASVTSIKEFYITTTSLSPTPTKDLDWEETLQTLTETNKYLWNYEQSILSDGKKIETNPIVIGVYGDNGKPGVGIESITEFYLVSASKSTPNLEDPRWSSTPSPTDQNNRYLWNREEIKYTDGSVKNIPPAIIGTHGDKGDKGDPTHFHRAWMDDENGTGFITEDDISDIEETLNKKFIGTYSSFDPIPSRDYSDYKWQRTAEDYAKEFEGVIGSEGKTKYNKNRLLGPVERIIEENESTLIEHNGEGYEIGKVYTISMDVDCIEADVVTWQDKSRTEIIPFVRETQFDPDLDPEESKITRIGVNGSATYTWKVELINGELTGNKTEEVRSNYKAPVNEIFTQGTKSSTWEDKSRTEVVPFVREIQYDPDLYPNQSRISRNGVNGSATYTWKVELVNGVLTGNKTEEVRSNYKAPINEIFIQGTKAASDVTFNFNVIPFVPPVKDADDVTFNFDIVPFNPPVKPRSNVTFNFNGENIKADDWYATPSVKVSNINRAPSTWKTMSLVDDFGAVGDGITDDSQALRAALQHSNNEPIRLDVGGSEYEYYIPSNGNNRIENYPGVSKGIVIFGNGAVFAPKNQRTIDKHEFYLMQIRAEKNAFVETYGFTLDGKHNPQDMFWWISQGKATRAADLPLQKGISYEGSDNIYIHDMTYRNMYGGYLIKLKQYTNVDIQNIRGYSVGGNDNPDSFGTIVHIDGQPDDSYINIDNMIIHGKKSPLNPAWVSWIGIVIENGTTQSDNPDVRLADRNTNIHVTNSEFYDFESLYHIETQAGNIYWNTDNVKARVMNYTIGAGVRGEIIDRSNHMKLDILPFMRKGLSSGLYHTYRERPSNNLTDENGAFNNFHMYNSIINYLPKEDYVGGVDVHAVAHADSVVANLHNVTLNNVPRWLVANASANLYDTQVNLKQGYNSSYSIFSNQEQFLKIHGTTKYNQAGSWKEASEGNYPPLAVNTGFVAPPLTSKIGDILPPA